MVCHVILYYFAACYVSMLYYNTISVFYFFFILYHIVLVFYLFIYIYIYTQLTSSIYVSNRANLPRTGPGGPSHASVAVVDVTFVAFHDFLLATAMAEEPKVPKSVKAKGICCVSIYIYI